MNILAGKQTCFAVEQDIDFDLSSFVQIIATQLGSSLRDRVRSVGRRDVGLGGSNVEDMLQRAVGVCWGRAARSPPLVLEVIVALIVTECLMLAVALEAAFLVLRFGRVAAHDSSEENARSAFYMTVVEHDGSRSSHTNDEIPPEHAVEDMQPALPFRQRAYTFFVCFAVAIGTGILSLPVKLYNAGFAPFVLLFTSTLVAEIAITWLTIDLLQRADQNDAQLKTVDVVEEIELKDLDQKANNRRIKDDDDRSNTAVSLSASPTTSSVKSLSTSPSFYKLGEVFLSPFWQRVFSFCVVAKYTSILIGYALAGSKGICQLADCDPTDAIVPFILFFTGVVVFLFHIVQPIITAIVCI